MSGLGSRAFSRLRPGLGRNLDLLLAGQLVSVAGSRIFDIVLVWYALNLSESYTSVGLLVFLRYIPYALFGLVCGWLSDRLNRRRLIVATDLFRGVLLMGAAGVLAAGLSSLAVLAATAFLLTAARTLFQPALQGLIPQLARGDGLVRANALLHGATEMIGVIAPVLGGVMLAVLPVSAILVAVALCFGLGAVMAAMVRTPREPAPAPIRLADFVTEYRDLWQVLSGRRCDALAAILMNAVAILGVSGILSLLIPILIKDHLGAGPSTLGVLWGIMALGTMLGAMISVRFPADQRERGMVLAWLVYGLLIGALVLPTQLGWVLAIGFILGATGAIADVLFATIVQERMPCEHVSKTFASFSTLANCGEAISAPILGIVAASFGLSAGFALGALLPVVASLVYVVHLAQRRPHDNTERST